MENENKTPELTPLQLLTMNFESYLHLHDLHYHLIEVCLAVRLSLEMEGTPIWLLVVGPSGDGKSELTMAFDDHGKKTYILHELTPNSLVSGDPKKKNEVENMDGKLILIPDMAQILHLNPNDKAKVWSQLRELYDGRAGRKTGMASDKQDSYTGIRVTMLGCSTPAIDSQILIFNELGTRELIFRTESTNNDELMAKVIDNEQEENKMREDLRNAVSAFLHDVKFRRVEPEPEAMNEIKHLVRYLRLMRADAEIDGYTGDLRNLVYPEQPTRVLKQLKRLYMALMSLEEGYSSVRALWILRHIVKSSVLPLRAKILNILKKSDPEMTVYEMNGQIKVGNKPIISQLNVLWHLGLVARREDIVVDHWGYERGRKYYWKITETGKDICIDDPPEFRDEMSSLDCGGERIEGNRYIGGVI